MVSIEDENLSPHPRHPRSGGLPAAGDRLP